MSEKQGEYKKEKTAQELYTEMYGVKKQRDLHIHAHTPRDMVEFAELYAKNK